MSKRHHLNHDSLSVSRCSVAMAGIMQVLLRTVMLTEVVVMVTNHQHGSLTTSMQPPSSSQSAHTSTATGTSNFTTTIV